MPNVVVVDCATGRVTARPMTVAEVAAAPTNAPAADADVVAFAAALTDAQRIDVLARRTGLKS